MAMTDPRLATIRDRVAQLLSTSPDGGVELPSEGDELDQIAAGLDLLAAEVVARRSFAETADQRIGELAKMMGSLVAFDFSPRAPVSDRGDVFDGFAYSLNMMAEELGATTVSSEFVDNILQSMTEPIAVIEPGSRIIAVNRATCQLTGYDEAELKGLEYKQLFSQVSLHEIIERGRVVIPETLCTTSSGKAVPVALSASVLLNKMGDLQGMVCVARDLREIRQNEAERWQMREAMHRQSILLEELSTPLIPITDQIVVMPLIGTVDTNRAKQMSETLLQGIKSLRARVAIVDVTGLRTVDQAAMQGIISAIRGVRLLGAEIVLTGIRPEIAITLVSMGSDIAGIVTTGTLQAGIQEVVSRLGSSGSKANTAQFNLGGVSSKSAASKPRLR